MQLNLARPGRHSVVWLTNSGWKEAVRSAQHEHREILPYWIELDLPLIVRRKSDCDPPNCLYLGLSLPPSRGKLRVPLAVSFAAVKEARGPFLLSDVILSAPIEWKKCLRELVDRLLDRDISPQVYGAFTWQHLTSYNYVTTRSDVDLLINFSTSQRFEEFTRVVHDWETVHGKTIDGELLFPNNSAIAWREVKSNSRQVLIKSEKNARLVSRNELKRWMSVVPESPSC